jgi:pimeloyl-ACP methyl ester carboxylesterase
VRPTRLLFLHANGFPAAVYRRFLDRLSADLQVVLFAVLQTPAATPAALRWRRMREQVDERLLGLGAADGGTALVGHSMGGYLALMSASRALPDSHPVVLIDSPIPARGRGALLSLAQGTGLIFRVGPARIAARRRHTWQDRAQARAFFAGKPFVQRWAPGVLDDFIEHALRELPLPAASETGAGGVTTLRIPREEERDIYAGLPHRQAARALQRLRGAGTAVGFVAGRSSEEMRMAGWEHNRRLFGDRFAAVDAGHLAPLEAPEACAKAVLALLDR